MQINDTFNDFFMQDMTLVLENYSNDGQNPDNTFINPANGQELPNHTVKDFLVQVGHILERERNFALDENRPPSKDIMFLVQSMEIGNVMSQLGLPAEEVVNHILGSYLTVAGDWLELNNQSISLEGQEYPNDAQRQAIRESREFYLKQQAEMELLNNLEDEFSKLDFDDDFDF